MSVTNQKPLLSIVIPVYNRKSDLEVTLESLSEIPKFSYEVIVVDDGSEDETDCGIVNQYEQCRLLRKANGGLASARNEGISLANGDYLYFLDAGDRPVAGLDDYLSNVVKSRCDLAVCSWTKIDGAEKLYEIPQSLHNPGNMWLQSNIAPVHSYIVRRSFVGTCRFNVTYKYVEDWNFWVRLVLRGASIKTFPDYSAVYEVTADSMSKNRLGMAISCCRNAHEIRKLCDLSNRNLVEEAKTVEKSTYSQLWAYLRERNRLNILAIQRESCRCGFPHAGARLLMWILYDKWCRIRECMINLFSKTPA